ncbi:hypothetical protein BD309DRAFT_510702 [Dichomitus squalens]|nr:hypothetical protein BD309DRAFT_510702 [Dichomitus squalens]
MCRTSVCRFLLGSRSNPGTPKTQWGSDVAEANGSGPSSATTNAEAFPDSDHDGTEVKAEDMDSGSGDISAEAKRESISFNRDTLLSDTFSTTSDICQTHFLATSLPFNSTSFLAAYLFSLREHSLNHTLLPIGSYHPESVDRPPPHPVISPIRHSLGLDPEALKVIPSLQPGTAEEERARRREVMSLQEKFDIPKLLQQVDAAREPSRATIASTHSRTKRTDDERLARQRDKSVPRSRSSAQLRGQSTRPRREEAVKCTVTPVSWGNPLAPPPSLNASTASLSPNVASTVPPSSTTVSERARTVLPKQSSKSLMSSSDMNKQERAPSISASSSHASRILATGSRPRTSGTTSPLESGVPVELLSLEELRKKGLESMDSCIARAEELGRRVRDTTYPSRKEIYEKLVREGKISSRIERPIIPSDHSPKDAERVTSYEGRLHSKRPTDRTSNERSTESLAQTIDSSRSRSRSRPSTVESTHSGRHLRDGQSTAVTHQKSAQPRKEPSRIGSGGSDLPAQQASSPARDVRTRHRPTRSRPNPTLSGSTYPHTSPENTARDSGFSTRTEGHADRTARSSKRSGVSTGASSKSSVTRPYREESGTSDSKSFASLSLDHASIQSSQSGSLSSDPGDRLSPTNHRSSHRFQFSQPPTVQFATSTARHSRSTRKASRSGQDVIESKVESEKATTQFGEETPFEDTDSHAGSDSEEQDRRWSTIAIVSDASPIWEGSQWTSQDAEEEDSEFESSMTGETPRTARDTAFSDLQASEETVLGSRAATASERDMAPSFPSSTRPAAVAQATDFNSSSEESDWLAKPRPAEIRVFAQSSNASFTRSQRSSGISYATAKEPSSVGRDPPESPVTPRAPCNPPRNEPETPLLHCDFGSIVGDNTFSIVSEQVFDFDSYSLFASLLRPPPTIPGEVAPDHVEVTTTPPVAPRKFLRGRIEPVWREPPVEPTPVDHAGTSIRAAITAEASSEESLSQSDTSDLDHKSVRLTIFPNASDTTFATSSGSGLSHGKPLSSTRPSSVPKEQDDDSDEDDPFKDPPSYDSVVSSRRRVQSDARAHKPRLLLDRRLRESYVEKVIVAVGSRES